ncbi:DUF6468 domain-containing protein [Sphingosinicella sp. BN140058]|uniref:DUF6468 domain-containing protein n=1 Tax=Sphingosinicella sp. BN140058 TaxID=1892855 RepID=UPI001980259D|nr:DUF6468 domain-containing protein [Sphingosinicella sp. BN140058]
MTFATLTNIVLILLCGAVLVQSVRMMRSFETMKKGGLKEVVEALDKATGQARHVLGDLKETLRTEGAANARTVAKGEEMREELVMMVGIANAVAERIVQTVEAAPKAPQADAEITAESDTKPARPKIPAKPERAKTEPAKRAPRRPAGKSAAEAGIAGEAESAAPLMAAAVAAAVAEAA